MTTLNDQEFIAFIESGSRKLTPRTLHQLISDLPELREKFAEVVAPGFPRVHRQLWLLADFVESFAMDSNRDVPYQAAIEGAFALLYLARDVDLIPDFISEIGFTDDAAVVATVMHRHAETFEQFATARKLKWDEICPEAK